MAEPIKVIPATELLDYQGRPYIRALEGGEDPSPITFKRAVQFAMSQPLRGDDSVEYKQKWLWHKIAERCEKAECTFNSKETTVILDRVGKVFGAMIFGRVKELIDPETDDA